MKNIPYGKQHIDNEDLKSVLKTLKSDKITQGLQIKRFENSLKNKRDFQKRSSETTC